MAPDDEEKLVTALQALRSMWLRAGGSSHPHLDALLDPALRADARTSNYLAATASGTIRDRFFTPANGDHLAEAEVSWFNDRYQALLAEAIALSQKLRLPATTDI